MGVGVLRNLNLKNMAKADLKVVGPAATWGRYLVAGGTAIEVGEPIVSAGKHDTHDGVSDANTYVLLVADGPIIAAVTTSTDRFGGIAAAASENVAAGTVKEQFLNCAIPVPQVGRIRGKAETAASVDTLTELALLIGDYTLFDYNGTGASDGGELYTIKQTASSNTSALEIVGGNPATSELEVVVSDQVYRRDYVDS
jgi:hypothetical protein